ncbi:MAG: DUF3078 domain-containing protein [Mangrovibacterium sp.]
MRTGLHCKLLLVMFFCVLMSFPYFARSQNPQREPDPENRTAVRKSLEYIRYFLRRQGNWYPGNKETERTLSGLVRFFDDEKIDSVLVRLKEYEKKDRYFFYRSPGQVEDSLSVPGYVSREMLEEQLRLVNRSVKGSLVREQIPVPEELLSDVDANIRLVPEDDADWLVRNSKIVLSDSLMTFSAVPDSMLISPADFVKIQRRDSIRRELLERARTNYNNRLRQQYRDSVSRVYREKYVEACSQNIQQHYADSIRRGNYNRLVQYNDSVMRVVNDSVRSALRILGRAAWKEPVPVWLHNTGKDSVQLWLQNGSHYFTRLFIKNEQNDSLSVRVENAGKNAMRFLIDDGVTFTRFKEKETREVDLPGFRKESSLQKVEKRFKVVTPWTLNGKADLGFTQTALSNWKAGGDNAFSFLFVFNGSADYAKNDVSWKNSVQIRNGWSKPGGDKLENNNDMLELTSRVGLKASKNWYYSSEVDFNTQLFNGYDYPDRDNPISGFLAPAYMTLKLGLDYNPNKKFSLLLSPVSAKMTYVKDSDVDPTNFGVSEGKSSYWKSGFNADLSWKKEITPDMVYNTKYKMFVSYNPFFGKYDINWENTLSLQLSTFINMNVRLYLVYDDDARFGTGRYDNDGVEITETRLQLQEIISIGFSYSLNKKVYRRKTVG